MFQQLVFSVCFSAIFEILSFVVCICANADLPFQFTQSLVFGKSVLKTIPRTVSHPNLETYKYSASCYKFLKYIMGVFTYTDEYISSIPPARLFKALIVDSHNLIPKLMPLAVKSIEITEGDGGAGSIRQINFAEGNTFLLMFIYVAKFHK